MPRAVYMDRGYDPQEIPDRAIEVLGRGPNSRSSKTYFKDGELAMLVGLVPQHVEHIEQVLRKLHAHHYTVEVLEEDEYGGIEVKRVPEVLDHDAIREEYPIIAKWEAFHRDQIGHYPSIGALSINATMRGQENGGDHRQPREESSAGADAGARERWR